MEKQLIISEPWDFSNPLSNDNIIEIEFVKELVFSDRKIDFVRVVNPFMYKGKKIDNLLLVPRYGDDLEPMVFNMLYPVIVDNSISFEDSEFIFIGSIR